MACLSSAGSSRELKASCALRLFGAAAFSILEVYNAQKILPIFFILCLVFSLTVTCFALDFQSSLSTTLNIHDGSLERDFITISHQNNIFTVDGYQSVSGGYTTWNNFLVLYQLILLIPMLLFPLILTII